VIDPDFGRAGFRIGVFILGLALVTLPLQQPGSVEFAVTVLAAIVGALFVAIVLTLVHLSRSRAKFPRERR
jgi:hypothetical protein